MSPSSFTRRSRPKRSMRRPGLLPTQHPLSATVNLSPSPRTPIARSREIKLSIGLDSRCFHLRLRLGHRHLFLAVFFFHSHHQLRFAKTSRGMDPALSQHENNNTRKKQKDQAEFPSD
ncbi:uncharacterized protein LOC130751387 isoform X2 [Actinidia eriantha]|uniref:uncharacterized protein LOC130751387 isoform X2 n=1 Tax=Actinidia eriantha TaxID=165200 RepID=UPI00258B0890|nr:uncharacterized protein LOC130751387 isoform X2 [Actinidia eriantha]